MNESLLKEIMLMNGDEFWLKVVVLSVYNIHREVFMFGNDQVFFRNKNLENFKFMF